MKRIIIHIAPGVKITLALALFVTAFIGAGVASAGEMEEEKMILIPAGDFLTGSSNEEIEKMESLFGSHRLYKDYSFKAEVPKKKMFLKAFYIDRHEVTNKEYFKFIKKTGRTPPRHWERNKYPDGLDNHPVLFVSYNDARSYAKWAGKRLPTELEWVKAARGPDGLVFPWGNEFDPFKAATADSDIMLISGALCAAHGANRVEGAKEDVSPYGVHDLAGNVREWTASVSKNKPAMALVKGASWVDLHVNARAAHAEYIPIESVSHIIGFRCAKDAK